MKYLFTNQKYPELNIPSTTNHIDGGINAQSKEANRRHGSTRIDGRNKLLISLLYNLGGKK